MLPINISITGHRDIKIEKTKEYQGKVRQVLVGLLKEYPNTKINLLCGMAEGSDILAAKIVLKLRDEYRINKDKSRVGLIAVLPMTKEEYIDTFCLETKERSIEEFEGILRKADKIFDLSKVYSNCTPNDNPYYRLGMYLVNNSQAIIALWNGVINHKKGGTSSVVEYALKGIPDEYRERYSITDSGDTIPVYHIYVERVSAEVKEQRIGYIESMKGWGSILYPKIWEDMCIAKESVEKYYKSIFTEFDGYNKNADKYKLESDGYLLSENSSVSIEEAKKAEGMEEIVQHQTCFSALAKKFQKKTWFFGKVQLFFGLISFLWVAIYDEILSNCKWIPENSAALILLLVPISVLVCILVYRMVNKKRIESRYYDYRAMSENLRVQFYWKFAGLKDNTFSHYSRKNEWELGWVLAAVKNISMEINYTLCLHSGKRNYNDIKGCWIDDQIAYFNKKSIKNKKTVRNNSLLKYFLFGLGVLAAILLFFQARWQIIGIPEFAFLFSVDFFLAFGAVFHNYLEQRQFENEYNQYKRMIMILTQAKVKFEKAYAENDYKSLDKILIEIGYDALAENADWVVFNRMSSISIPMG